MELKADDPSTIILSMTEGLMVNLPNLPLIETFDRDDIALSIANKFRLFITWGRCITKAIHILVVTAQPRVLIALGPRLDISLWYIRKYNWACLAYWLWKKIMALCFDIIIFHYHLVYRSICFPGHPNNLKDFCIDQEPVPKALQEMPNKALLAIKDSKLEPIPELKV